MILLFFNYLNKLYIYIYKYKTTMISNNYITDTFDFILTNKKKSNLGPKREQIKQTKQNSKNYIYSKKHVRSKIK